MAKKAKSKPQTIIISKKIDGVTEQIKAPNSAATKVVAAQTQANTVHINTAGTPTAQSSNWRERAELFLITAIAIWGLIVAVAAIVDIVRTNNPSVVNLPVAVAPTNQEGQSNDVPKSTDDKNGSVVADGGISTTNSGVQFYRLKASRGEGVFSMSRRAINQYIASKNTTLSAVQRVYVETKLTALSHPRPLKVAEERTFGFDRMERLINEAKALSPQAQQRWAAYL